MTGSVGEKSAGSGEAGHFGKDVRSDLHVTVDPRESGGLEITMRSRVAPYYGDSISAQARQRWDLAKVVKRYEVLMKTALALPRR